MFSETRYAMNGDLRVAYRASREGPRDIVLVANWFTNCEVLPELPSLRGWVEAMTSLGRLILFDQPPSTDYAMSCFRARGLVPSVRHRTHSHELTRSIVARGRSYAILVQRPPNKLSYEGLPILEKKVEPPLPTCPVILAWPRDRRPSPRVRALVELARRQYGGLMPATLRAPDDAGPPAGVPRCGGVRPGS